MRRGNRNPHVYIIAGPNGAGKTTFAQKYLPDYAHCETFINADLIARGVSPFSPESAALRAGRILLNEIDRHSDSRIDFAFETTLSGVTHLTRLKKLKKQSYLIHLYFLWIPNLQLSMARIRDRVRRGGHPISEKVARRRFYKGIRNLFTRYKPLLNTWNLFDNSKNVPRLIAKDESGKLEIFDRELFFNIKKQLGVKRV